jgi:type III restriction enzyme
MRPGDVARLKQDNEMEGADVHGKREAARRWANHSNADFKVKVAWRYLLVCEKNINTAMGS